MRSYSAICVLLVAVILIAFSNSSPLFMKLKPCNMTLAAVANCSSSETVCGRVEGTKVCRNFENICYMEFSSCAMRNYYDREFVLTDPEFCEGFAFNLLTICKDNIVALREGDSDVEGIAL